MNRYEAGWMCVCVCVRVLCIRLFDCFGLFLIIRCCCFFFQYYFSRTHLNPTLLRCRCLSGVPSSSRILYFILAFASPWRKLALLALDNVCVCVMDRVMVTMTATAVPTFTLFPFNATSLSFRRYKWERRFSSTLAHFSSERGVAVGFLSWLLAAFFIFLVSFFSSMWFHFIWCF